MSNISTSKVINQTCFDPTHDNYSTYWSSVFVHRVLDCYSLFFAANIAVGLFMYALFVACLLVNVWLLASIFSDAEKRANIFNKVLVCDCVVNLVTNVLDLPFYSVYVLYGYWPFGQAACMLWSILDNALNTLIIGHMLMLTWTRFASVFAPNTYKTHWLVRSPYANSAALWLFSLSVYAIVDFFFLLEVQDEYFACAPLYSPDYLVIVVQSAMIVMPIAAIVALTLPVMWVVSRRKRKPAAFHVNATSMTHNAATSTTRLQGDGEGGEGSKPDRKTSRFRLMMCAQQLSAQQKLTFILSVFMCQWAPIMVIWFTDSFCKCVPDQVNNVTYLLSYLVTFTDPLFVLLLNTQFNKIK